MRQQPPSNLSTEHSARKMRNKPVHVVFLHL